LADTKYAQPLIYKKMRERQQEQKIESLESQITSNQPAMSIADELNKLTKLKEQGVITEEEFLQMRNNLMKRI
jgi:multidrug resistance efflux pump